MRRAASLRKFKTHKNQRKKFIFCVRGFFCLNFSNCVFDNRYLITESLVTTSEESFYNKRDRRQPWRSPAVKTKT